MRLMVLLIAISVSVGSLAARGECADAPGVGQKDELFERTGLLLHGVPIEAPEDSLYPISNNLYKLDEFYRLNNIRLEARDLPRFERAFRNFHYSDGVFNVPEGISRADEWDAKRYQVAERGDDGQLVPLSKAEITQNRVNLRLYRRYSPLHLSSLGLLAKHCDGVFIGEVVNIESKNPPHNRYTTPSCGDSGKGDLAVLLYEVTLSFRVLTNIFGNVASRRATVPMLWVDRPLPVKGMKLLCFYTRGYKYNMFDDNLRVFFREKSPPGEQVPSQGMHGYAGSVRIIDDPEVERMQVDLANAYLQILRREKRDPVKYYELLRSLVKSPVWRIRQDAREDLLNLLHRPPDGWDLRPLADDPELAGIFRDYVRYVVIPKREQSQTDAANNVVSHKPKSAKPVLLLIR